MIPRQFFIRQLIHGKQCPQPRIGRLFNLPESVFHHNTVFIGKLHHISHCGKPGKSQKLPHKCCFPFLRHRTRPAHPLKINLHQFIGYYCTADSLIRIGTAALLRVNHRICLRQRLCPAAVLPYLIGHLVMIRHDHRHAKSFRTGGLGEGCNAVIAGQNRFYTIMGRLFNQPLAQSVSVRDAMGNHRIHCRAAGFQTGRQYVSGTDAVDVIVPDHAYPALSLCLFAQNPRRLISIFQKRRIVHIRHCAVKEFLHFFLPHHISVPYDSGNYRINVKPLRYSVKIRLLGGYHPFSHKNALRKSHIHCNIFRG